MLLGKRTPYPGRYSPEVLFRIDRSENRKDYDIGSNLFTGCDVWHAWEFSFLLNNGLPATGVLKIVYPSNSEYIVESKSLKLYLNSYNMSSFGNAVNEGAKAVCSIIAHDLKKIIDKQVYVSFHQLSKDVFDFEGYQKLETLINTESLHISDYNENVNYLADAPDCPSEFDIYSDLLRSNCKVTHQPDFGTVYIHYRGSKKISFENLLKYLISFRSENHFHEEVCEMIFKRISDYLEPTELMIACIYTRRGGIDICPVRSSHEGLLPSNLINTGVLSRKLLRQ
jgi:7-cyano-7-deazaguanine reductase